MQVLEDFLRLHEEAADLTHVNILAELLMEGHKWAEAQAAILQARQRAGEQPLPIDLQAGAPAGSHSTTQGWGVADRGSSVWGLQYRHAASGHALQVGPQSGAWEPARTL